MARKKNLGTMVDDELIAMMESKDEPSEGRLKVLNTAIKKLALDAKLEESEYGGFFGVGQEDENAPIKTRKLNGGSRIPAKAAQRDDSALT